MEECGVKLGLLEYLSFKTGCAFLSDLHDRKKLMFVQSEVHNMNPALFSLKEWNEAVRYITGENVDFPTREQAVGYLLASRKSG